MRNRSIVLVGLAAAVAAAVGWAPPMSAEETTYPDRGRQSAAPLQAPFELRDGDRVVFLGNGWIERAQEHGYIEQALTTRWPRRNITFRNLGWSGDTVYGEARGHYTNPPTAYEHLTEQVRNVGPTVIFVGYGSNAAFEGEAALPHFRDGLNRLLDDLEETGARIILLAPPPHEESTSPVPNTASHNAGLRLVTGVLATVATERGHYFINVFAALEEIGNQVDVPLTTNGIHLSPAGYFYAATAIEEGLGWPPRRWTVTVDVEEAHVDVEAADISALEAAEDAVQFTVKDARLPVPSSLPVGPGCERRLAVTGLDAGRYRLLVDGREAATASAAQWVDGVTLCDGPATEQAEQLREAIVAKNRLYFRRYRPQNETYLRGFREYEQGQNADELHQLEPLIDAKENQIGRLRVPRRQVFKLIPVEENEV